VLIANESRLYDQAQLLNVYLDAYIVTKDPIFLEVTRDLIKYMTSAPIYRSGGGFLASEGSDSLSPDLTASVSSTAGASSAPTQLTSTSPIAIPNTSNILISRATPNGQSSLSPDTPREGAYYVWTNKELFDVLGPHIGPLFARYYSCSPNGNVPYDFDPYDEFADQNVLSISSSPADTRFHLAQSGGYAGRAQDFYKELQLAKKKLREHRERTRQRPALDDKIVLSWNGLAMGALARAGVILNVVGETAVGEDADAPFESNKQAAEVATKAAEATLHFLQKEMYDAESGRLTRIWKQGRLVNKGLAFADDYGFLISGLLDVYEATGRSGILEWVEALQSKICNFTRVQH
jgi:uncharacterized protein YyaL (SSP411 family)